MKLSSSSGHMEKKGKIKNRIEGHCSQWCRKHQSTWPIKIIKAEVISRLLAVSFTYHQPIKVGLYGFKF